MTHSAASTDEPIDLVLVYVPGAVDPKDFKKIAMRVRAVASNITIFIVEDKRPDRALFERLLKNRTFVFAPHQLQALALGRGKRFDPAVLGEFVVVKPEVSSHARGVSIVRTRALNEHGAKVELYTRGGNNFIVQQLVCNSTFGKTRIQTLFDTVLFARRFRLMQSVRFETDEDMRDYQRSFITENTRLEDYDDPAVLALARRCCAAFDDVPTLALDVLFDEAGNPFFIEANPGGNTWHFSSAGRGQMLRARGTFLERQFGAFELAGDKLADFALAQAI